MDDSTTAAHIQNISNNVSNMFNYKQNQRQHDWWKEDTKWLNELQQEAEKRNYQYNIDFSNYAYQKNLEQWNRENAYNSPAAQMARYRGAGLNANLIYGQPNLSAASPEMSVGEVNTGPGDTAPKMDMAQLQTGGVAQLALQGQQMELQKQIVDANTNKTNAETLGILMDNDVKGSTLDAAKQTIIENLTSIQQQNQNLTAQYDSIKQQTAYTHELMIKTSYETEYARWHSEIEKLFYQKEHINSAYYDAHADLDLKIKKSQLAFNQKQTAMIEKQLQYADEEKKTHIAYESALILGVNATTTAQDLENKINRILQDPDTPSDEYWAALNLRALAKGADKFSYGNVTELIALGGMTLMHGVESGSKSHQRPVDTPTGGTMHWSTKK